MKKVIVALYVNPEFHTVNGEQDIIKISPNNQEELLSIVENANNCSGFIERLEIEFMKEEG